MIPSNRADASDAASDEIENKFAETALVHLPFGLVDELPVAAAAAAVDGSISIVI